MDNQTVQFWSDEFIAGIYEGYYLALFHKYDGSYAQGDDEEMHMTALARTEQHVAENYPDRRFKVIQLRLDYKKLGQLKRNAVRRQEVTCRQSRAAMFPVAELAAAR